MDNLFLENSKEKVVLGVTIDKKLKFHSHIKTICKKDTPKLQGLLKIENYLHLIQKTLY